MKIGFKVGILGLAIVGMASAASAAPLGLVKTYPDIYSEAITINYSSATHVLTASGDVSEIVPKSGSVIGISNGIFSLNVTLDTSGNATSGSLTITGTPDSYAGFTSTGTLLTGSLLPTGGFGFTNSNSDVFGFVFNVTGGDAASIWQPKIGIILNANENLSDLNNALSSNFGSSGLGSSDSFAVPEPLSIAILGLSGLALLARKRSATH